MKKYWLYLAVCVMSWNHLFAEIKNGYGLEIALVRESLKSLSNTREKDCLSIFQKGQINHKISLLLEFITYYELTEELLVQFRTVAPDLYNEIDSIKDKRGRAVDVFVKFSPETQMFQSAHGTTNLGQLKDDPDAYQSEYGPGSVSVKIASVSKSLSLLAHEFGHVKYQAPNLATYMQFYLIAYQNNAFHSNYLGHNSNDRSGREAINYEKMFHNYQSLFLKTASIKMENPMGLLATIRASVGKYAH